MLVVLKFGWYDRESNENVASEASRHCLVFVSLLCTETEKQIMGLQNSNILGPSAGHCPSAPPSPA